MGSRLCASLIVVLLIAVGCSETRICWTKDESSAPMRLVEVVFEAGGDGGDRYTLVVEANGCVSLHVAGRPRVVRLGDMEVVGRLKALLDSPSFREAEEVLRWWGPGWTCCDRRVAAVTTDGPQWRLALDKDLEAHPPLQQARGLLLIVDELFRAALGRGYVAMISPPS